MEKQLYSLYDGKVQIEFLPGRHAYKLPGERTYLISVTGATGIVDKSRMLVPWAVGLSSDFLRKYLENAGQRMISVDELLPVIDEASRQHTIKKEAAADVGSTVHDWAMQCAKAKMEGKELPEIPTLADTFTEEQQEQIHTAISSFLDWYNSHDVQFEKTELVVYSKKHKYVGTTDVIAKIDGKRFIGDYKTAKGVYTDMRYQLAGYRIAYEEEYGKDQFDGSVILHFDKITGEFTVHEFSNEDYAKDAKVFLACLTVKQREKELAVW